MSLSATQYNRGHSILYTFNSYYCCIKFLSFFLYMYINKYTYIASLINTICHWIKLVYCLKWNEKQMWERKKKWREKENLFTHNDFIRIFDSPLFDIHHQIHTHIQKTISQWHILGVSQTEYEWKSIWEQSGRALALECAQKNVFVRNIPRGREIEQPVCIICYTRDHPSSLVCHSIAAVAAAATSSAAFRFVNKW